MNTTDTTLALILALVGSAESCGEPQYQKGSPPTNNASAEEPTKSNLQISSPRANSVVSGEVIELIGVGADPAGTLEVEVLTNRWYLQDGKTRINSDGAWTFSPVYVSGQGTFNNHTIRVTQTNDGRRGTSATVVGIVRKQ